MNTKRPIDKEEANSSLAERSMGYEGRAGRTRLERFHVRLEHGEFDCVELYRVVNVCTHPFLRAKVLCGELHRVAPYGDLAVPFVYHDPYAQKFALVLPTSFVPYELKERAKLLTEIAEDVDHAIPSYMRDPVVVFGISQLDAYVQVQVASDAKELLSKTMTLAERERNLEQFMKTFELREREFQEKQTQLATLQAEVTETAKRSQARERRLAIREQALDMRLEVVRQRERNVSVEPPSSDFEAIQTEFGSEPHAVLGGEPDARASRISGAFNVLNASGALPDELFDLSEPEAKKQSSSSPLRQTASLPREFASNPQISANLSMAQNTLRAELSASSAPNGLTWKQKPVGELVEALNDPQARFAAGRELCRRGDSASLRALVSTLRDMSQEQVAILIASLVPREQTATPVLLHALTSNAAHVRQAAILGLSTLRAGDALEAVVRILKTEEPPLWQEVARALAVWGRPALDVILSHAGEDPTTEERLVYAMCCLANRGWEHEVRALTENGSSMDKRGQLALEALALKEVVRAEEAALEDAIASSHADPVRELSNQYYRELELQEVEGPFAKDVTARSIHEIV